MLLSFENLKLLAANYPQNCFNAGLTSIQGNSCYLIPRAVVLSRSFGRDVNL